MSKSTKTGFDAAKLRRRRGISYKDAMKLLSHQPSVMTRSDTKAGAQGKDALEGTRPGELHNAAHHGKSQHGGNHTRTQSLTGHTVKSGTTFAKLHNAGYRHGEKGQHGGGHKGAMPTGGLTTHDIDKRKSDQGQRGPGGGAASGGNLPAPHRPTEDIRAGSTTKGKHPTHLEGAERAVTRAHAARARAKSMSAGRRATKGIVTGDNAAPWNHRGGDRIAFNAEAEGNPLTDKITGKKTKHKHRKLAARLLERQYK